MILKYLCTSTSFVKLSADILNTFLFGKYKGASHSYPWFNNSLTLSKVNYKPVVLTSTGISWDTQVDKYSRLTYVARLGESLVNAYRGGTKMLRQCRPKTSRGSSVLMTVDTHRPNRRCTHNHPLHKKVALKFVQPVLLTATNPSKGLIIWFNLFIQT